MSMRQRLFLPRDNFCVLFTWRKVTSARRVTRCCTTGNPPLEVAQGNKKLMWTITGVRPCTKAKLTPGNELSRDHVNRGLMSGIRVCATDQGRFFISKNPEQAPNFEGLLQNRPDILKFYSRMGSLLTSWSQMPWLKFQKSQLLSSKW